MSTSKPHSSVFIHTALPCEAKPLIEAYKLKKDTSINHFAIHKNNNIYLTVTGIGKTAMAAGVAYTQALFADQANPVMLNIGIAGHHCEALGSLFLIDKITDGESGRSFYPPLVFTPPCPTVSLQTHSKPQTSYPDAALCDMEGSAFYETATRFSTGELCHCIKVVSDNAQSPAQQIDVSMATALIQAKIDLIKDLIETLLNLASGITTINNSNLLETISQQYRFTVSEQIQLQKILSRWSAVNGKTELDLAEIGAITGKEFLALLNQKINDTPFLL